MYFDRFPLELIYELFSYFSCHEILHSFYSINRYFDNIIRNYPFYYLDLSSNRIRKREFGLICLLIHPEQMLGLKIGKTRFNLIEEYFNSIDGKRFSRLRSLWLDETILFNEIYSQWIYSVVNSSQLYLFRFDAIDKFVFIKRLNSTFENLSHLSGCSSELFRRLSNQIPTHLTFLHMFFNSIDDLIYLLDFNFHQLKSLGIGIKCNSDDINRFASLLNSYQWKKLIQFNLNLQEVNDIRWETIKEILSPMSQLRYLTLILSKQRSLNSRLFNGYEWSLLISILLPYLKKFSLKLPFDEESEDRIKECLDTFQTSWWLNVKQWYIEYLNEDNALITVPDYSPKIFDNSNLSSFHSKFYYMKIRELKLNLMELNHFNEFDRSYFIQVNCLSLNGTLTKDLSDQIRHFIDIHKIEHFQIISTDDHFHEYVQLISDMSHLSSLDIQCIHSLRLFRLISSPLFSIRRLVLLGCEATTIKRVYSDLCSLFPNLIELTSEYQSRRILSYLLNNLFYIEQINFRLNQYNHVPNHRWIEEHTRLISDSFQSDIFYINYKERLFIIWINQDKNIDQTPSRHKHHKCSIQ